MYFDSHSHMDDRRFDGDREAIMEDLKNHGVGLLMNVGCDLESSERSVALAERYPFVYAAVGSHPDDADRVDGKLLDRYRSLAGHEKVRAIGELPLWLSSILRSRGVDTPEKAERFLAPDLGQLHDPL